MWSSAFEPMLAELVAGIVGAFAAVLVDAEGETVDYSGRSEAFDLRIAGAHMRLLLEGMRRGTFRDGRWLYARAARRAYIGRLLPEGYAVVVLQRGRAADLFFVAQSRAFSVFERALRKEAGWPTPQDWSPWYRVRATCRGDGRPIALEAATGLARSLEVLGSIVGLPKPERGYRVRSDRGEELTLIREPGGRWYADEDPARLLQLGGP